MMSDPKSEFQELLDLLCDGELSPEQQERLALLLEKSPERQREYLQYLDLHARMREQQNSDVFPIKSVTLKQMTVEFGTEEGGSSGQGQVRNLPAPQKKSWSSAWIVIVILIAIVLGAMLFRPEKQVETIASVTQSNLKTGLAIYQSGAELSAGEHTIPVGDITVQLTNGVQLQITGPASFGLISLSEIKVETGSYVVHVPQSDNLFKLKSDAAEFHMTEANFSLQQKEGSSNWNVDVMQGEVIVLPKRWKPRHYWNFDRTDSQVKDVFGEAHGQLTAATKRVPGLVGGGAIEFDNTPNSAIALGSGGGKALATGSFAVDEGITLEALLIPKWTGKGFTTGEEKDYDEIIRKEGDGELRFLLSFQNDNPDLNDYSNPKRKAGQVLAFGLYLIGEGYEELEIPLDQKTSSVSLADLQDGDVHHVVATYNTETGLKAIYIDGQLCEQQQYKPGTRPLTGGPGELVIGNITPPHLSGNEPFNGVLDEVAFYDFAISEIEVAAHFQQIQNARNYFGGQLEYQYVLQAGEQVTLETKTGLRIPQK